MNRIRSHLSRLTLRRGDPQVAPMLKTLMPELEDQAMAVQHRLMWTLFADQHSPQNGDGPDGWNNDGKSGDQSPFLWRQLNNGREFLALGPAPLADSAWFTVETKPYDINLGVGQSLAFDLRLNATVNRMVNPAKGRSGRQRCDIVMDALRDVPSADRAGQRDAAALNAYSQWLARQGSRPQTDDQPAGGFQLSSLNLVSYRTLPMPKRTPGKGKQPLVGVADLQGELIVTDPAAFQSQIEIGFGRLKAFGCGLMLLRPARGMQ